MKTFTFALLVAAASATSWDQDVELAAGVLYGITKKDGLETLTTCMTDADIFSMELIHAVGLIREKDERGAIAGYRLIMSAIQQFPSFLEKCESTSSDLKGLESFFLEFIHPIDLVKRVTHNALHSWKDLTKNTLQARADLKGEDYFRFGEEIGTIAVILTQPKVTPPAEVEISAFL